MKGIIDVPGIGTTRQPGTRQPRRMLDAVVATSNTVLCIVAGEGGEADAASIQAESLASKAGCEPVQVVRVRDERVLSPAEAGWKRAGDKLVTLLTFDRRISSRLSATEAADAGDFLIAMTDAIAGRTR